MKDSYYAQNIIKQTNFKPSITLIICLVLIGLSGTIQFSYIWFSQSIVAFLILSIIFLVLIKNKTFNKVNVLICITLLLIVLINLMVYSKNINGHLGLVMKIISCFIVAQIIDFEKLKKYYINIIFIIAIISLICFSIFVFNPSIVFQFIKPITYWDHTTRYMLVFNFPLDNYTIRNFGPFHEGGMFAVFLNLAILWIFEKESLSSKMSRLKILVFIAAIITTVSTSGIIACGLIVIIKSRRIILQNLNFKTVSLLLIVLLTLVIAENKMGIISNKFSADNASYTARSSEIPLFYETISTDPILGIGFQNNSYLNGTGITDATNGILSVLSQFGLLGGGTILLIYCYSIRKMSVGNVDYMLKLFVVFLFFASEPTIFTCMFLILIFAGIKEGQERANSFYSMDNHLESNLRLNIS
ncbi:hypothetical protein SAMN05216378_4278 [Paenibacillus catalpae]|uniref:O-Antigen ligase n=1 Tax=Paenibacillus catalpae TaxID=1045775 RepID=A0A1I2DTS9_9BACL|nr:hypothetical protein [Paenibacillus catalpae]SFE83985.1 hypothetical protein SAMN05216378_4278 [Paenibacillus catalpae]